jgi:hypothetical protein
MLQQSQRIDRGSCRGPGGQDVRYTEKIRTEGRKGRLAVAQVPRHGFSFVLANYVPRAMCLGGARRSFCTVTRRKIALQGMKFNQASLNTETETEISC